jgi:hypothetical protein
MWSRRRMALPVLAVLFSPTSVWAGSCDLVFRWDERAIDACIRELKSEIFMLRLQLQTEAAENQVARGNICLLGMDSKTAGAAEIAEIACAELTARAAEKKEKSGSRPAKI